MEKGEDHADPYGGGQMEWICTSLLPYLQNVDLGLAGLGSLATDFII